MDNVLEAVWQLMKNLVLDATSPLYFDGVAGTATTTPHGMRAVFKGDPNQITDSDQPCLIVRPGRSRWVQGMSRYDRKEHTIDIVLVENYKNYRETNNSNARIVQSVPAIIQQMEQTDTNQKTLGTTVVGRMLQNITLPYTSGGTKYASVDLYVETIDYVFNTSRGFPTFEAIAVFRVVTQGDRA